LVVVLIELNWSVSVQEKRSLERNIREIERDERKIKQNLHHAVKKNYTESARRMAIQLVKAKRYKERIEDMISQLNTLMVDLRQASARLRLTNTLDVSTKVMESLNNISNYSTITKNMNSLSTEMDKAGLVQELMEDSIDAITDVSQAEDEEKINLIIEEATKNVYGSFESAPSALPTHDETKQIAETGKTILLESFQSHEKQPVGIN